jgi:hypothetical protein
MATFAAEPEVEASLRQLLAEPPFASSSLDGRLLERLAEWYRSHIQDLYINEPVVFWISVIGLTLVVILLTWHIFTSTRTVWRALRRRPGVARESSPAGPVLQLGGARTALANGDHRACVELCWLAVMDACASPAEVTETPRSQARRLAARLGPAERVAIHQLLGFHEQACYAGAPTTIAIATDALATAETLGAGARDG